MLETAVQECGWRRSVSDLCCKIEIRVRVDEISVAQRNKSGSTESCSRKSKQVCGSMRSVSDRVLLKECALNLRHLQSLVSYLC